jgi:isopentenyl-diphosphate delta-isomerase type 1
MMPSPQTETQPRPLDPELEILAIVDESDQIIGSASRAEIHRQQLRHRAVHILVVGPAGEVFVQRRAEHKDCDPGLWDTSAAGHVDYGETYVAAALRELTEELAIEGELLRPLWDLPATALTGNEFVRVYVCETAVEPIVNYHEIVDSRWYAPTQLAAHIARDPHCFTAVFREIFARFGATMGNPQ